MVENSLNRLIRCVCGKKSAQIREILISESAWEEMTCLFAPSQALQRHQPGCLWHVAIAMHGTKADSLALDNSTVTGDIGAFNENGTTLISLTNNSVVNGNVTVDGNAANSVLVITAP
jgi:hypothetical protein